ncbi:MAG: DUF4349 domain-containing protein [Pseudomonadota bacterium]
MRAVVLVLAVSLALTACSKSEQSHALKDLDVMEMKAPAVMATDAVDAAAASPAIPQAEPQIAYSYTYGYRVGSGEIDAVQAKHVALCDKLGRLRCRIATMQKSSVDGEFSNATLQLMVDAKIARAFGAELDTAVSDAGGEASDRGIQAEDLSKQMVDTQARITAKQALADRLLTLIKTGGGKVGDLVEAERAFADAQEELDAARSNMAEMQGRVALSKVEITYTSRNAGGGFTRPIREAFAEGGRTMGWSIGALVTFVIVVAPWVALLTLLLWIKRRMGWRLGWRWPWSRRAEPPTS